MSVRLISLSKHYFISGSGPLYSAVVHLAIYQMPCWRQTGITRMAGIIGQPLCCRCDFTKAENGVLWSSYEARFLHCVKIWHIKLNKWVNKHTAAATYNLARINRLVMYFANRCALLQTCTWEMKWNAVHVGHYGSTCTSTQNLYLNPLVAINCGICICILRSSMETVALNLLFDIFWCYLYFGWWWMPTSFINNKSNTRSTSLWKSAFTGSGGVQQNQDPGKQARELL